MPARPSSHRSRTAVALAALVAIIALSLSACGSDSTAGADGGEKADPTTEPFTLRVGFIGTKPDWGGPEGYANHLGTLVDDLKAVGVTKIDAFQFGNGPDLNQALTGGSLDLGIYGDTPAINARAAGLKTRVINQGRINLSATLVTPKGGVTSLEDLAGKSIGVPKGSYMHRFVLGLLDEEGLADDVTVTNLLIPDAAAALERGDIAAFAAPWSFVPILDAQGFPSLLSTFPDHADLAGSSVTVVTEKLLAERPDLPKAWKDARAAVLTTIKADPDPYFDFVTPIVGLDRAVIPTVENLDDYPEEPFTDEGLALLEGTKAFLVDIKAAMDDFDIADWQAPSS